MHVTILMPAYNRANFISEAIKSVFDQTYKDWDILVVDDGSTDGTADKVIEWMSDQPITLIKTKHGGCAHATKIGLEKAKGPIITVLDSDDRLLPLSLAVVVPHFKTNPKLGYLWTQFVKSNGGAGWSKGLPKGKNLRQALENGWWSASHQRFLRKDAYLKTKGLDAAYPCAVDLQLVLLLANTDCETKHVSVPTYWYRFHPKMMTRVDKSLQRDCAKQLIEMSKNKVFEVGQV